jgi:hypothetical protein
MRAASLELRPVPDGLFAALVGTLRGGALPERLEAAAGGELPSELRSLLDAAEALRFNKNE